MSMQLEKRRGNGTVLLAHKQDGRTLNRNRFILDLIIDGGSLIPLTFDHFDHVIFG